MLGKLSVVLCLVFGFGWTVARVGLVDVARLSLPEHDYGWQVFMGGWVVALMISPSSSGCGGTRWARKN
jgi:hypothetical protein